MKITRFEDLECWQQGRKLTNSVYNVTANGAFNRDFRLSSQIQAAATSVMANIAEGFARHTDKEFIQFLFISMSSAAEVQSHLYVALDRDYVDQQQFDELYGSAKKAGMLTSGLVKYLRSNPTRQTTKPSGHVKPNRSDRQDRRYDRTDRTD